MSLAPQRIKWYEQEFNNLEMLSNSVWEEHMVMDYSQFDRYSDIKTYAWSRVNLQKRNNHEHDYINACHVGSPFDKS